MRPYILLLFIGFALLLTGCGSDGKPVRVTGVVRSKGKPIPNLIVHFVPEQGRESRGTTDNNGEFKLSYERGTEGAVKGKHKVYFEFRPHDPRQESSTAAIPPDIKAILAKYGKQNSSLQYEVTKDGQEITIDLD
jgi:hypothetical protein